MKGGFQVSLLLHIYRTESPISNTEHGPSTVLPKLKKDWFCSKHQYQVQTFPRKSSYLSGAGECYFVNVHVRCDGCPCRVTHSWDDVDNTSRESHLNQRMKTVKSGNLSLIADNFSNLTMAVTSLIRLAI